MAKDAGSVEGWLIILKMHIGDVLFITKSGENLNLRSAPSLSGSVLNRLKPGDAVTITEGPINSDGYTWWKMRLDDGTGGWAVEMPGWYERRR